MSGKRTPKQKDYTEFTTLDGVVLHIFTPPLEIISGIVPKRPKPTIPLMPMKTADGGTQNRVVKEGDPGWQEYHDDLEAWNDEAIELREAAKVITALQDFQFPEPLTFPPKVQEMIDLELVSVPDHPYLKKMMWLRSGVLTQNDEVELDFVIQERTGVPTEVIDQFRDNFRNFYRRQVADGMGKNTEGVEAAEDNEEQSVVSDGDSSDQS